VKFSAKMESLRILVTYCCHKMIPLGLMGSALCSVADERVFGVDGDGCFCSRSTDDYRRKRGIRFD
jgi:hypothetical protein